VYQWWVFVHLVGVFGFLIAHGVSMFVAVRLRTERDPRRVSEFLQLSSSAIRAFYVALALLLVGGITAGFLGHWWGRAWIWASIAVLVLTTLAMYGLATPYYRRVGLVARAKADGETSVTDEQFEGILRSGRSSAVMAIGMGGLLIILYFMVFKPGLGLSQSSAAPLPSGNAARVVAGQLAFDRNQLEVSAGQPITIVFDNSDPGVPHNVSVYRDSSASGALFAGEVVTGPRTITYSVDPLEAGSYFFRCDVHPTTMTGTLVVS
jgi:plastocyanin